MDLEYYRNFLTIVEEGSLTAAAQKLNLAQPALSSQLKLLEQNYGIKLLKLRRGVRKVQLTQAGEIFYEKAKSLSLLEESARLELQNSTRKMAGTLKVSLSPARAASFVKKYLKEFCQLYPEVNYQIQEVDVHTQVQHILSSISDFAIANAPLPDPHRFKILHFEKDSFVCVLHQNNHLLKKKKKKLALADLARESLCTNFGSYPLLDLAFQAASLSPHFLALSTTRMTALQFAEQKLGVAVIPAEKGELFAPPLVAVTLAKSDLFATKTVFTQKNKALSQIAENFLAFYLKASQAALKTK